MQNALTFAPAKDEVATYVKNRVINSIVRPKPGIAKQRRNIDRMFAAGLNTDEGSQVYRLTDNKPLASGYTEADILDADLTLAFNRILLSLMYEADNNSVLGLIAKAHYESYDEQNYETASDLYQRALTLSQNEKRVADLITNFVALVVFSDTERLVANIVQGRRPLFNLIHKIKPDSRPIEKAILSNMYQYYYAYGEMQAPLWEGDDEEIFFALKHEINHHDQVYKQGASKTSNESGAGCFIATAVFGSPFEHEVIILRAFRNQYLLNRKLGKYFVQWYYRISPFVAAVITRNRLLRAITRQTLRPTIFLAKRLDNFCDRGKL